MSISSISTRKGPNKVGSTSKVTSTAPAKSNKPVPLRRKSSPTPLPPASWDSFNRTEKLPPLIMPHDAHLDPGVIVPSSQIKPRISPNQPSFPPITPLDGQPVSSPMSPMPNLFGQQSNHTNLVSSPEVMSATYPGGWQYSPSSLRDHAQTYRDRSSSGSRPHPNSLPSYTSQMAHHNQVMRDGHASSLSPDSRPTTGYSVSSVSSTTYDSYSRPNSSHLAISPVQSRPSSSKSGFNLGLGIQRRIRRSHSQAVSPYPPLYEHDGERHSRPMTQGSLGDTSRQFSLMAIPRPMTVGNGMGEQRPSSQRQQSSFDHHHLTQQRPATYDPATMHYQRHHSSTPQQSMDLEQAIRRVQNMPSVAEYNKYGGQGQDEVEFAFSAVPGAVGPTAMVQAMQADKQDGHTQSYDPHDQLQQYTQVDHRQYQQYDNPGHPMHYEDLSRQYQARDPAGVFYMYQDSPQGHSETATSHHQHQQHQQLDSIGQSMPSPVSQQTQDWHHLLAPASPPKGGIPTSASATPLPPSSHSPSDRVNFKNENSEGNACE